jgi:hypothetical protein
MFLLSLQVPEMSEMLRKFADRPVIVKDPDGLVTYVSVHDQYYLSTKRAWRQVMRLVHPDMGGRSKEFRRKYKQFQGWKQQERRWYWRYRLMPPDWKGGTPRPPVTTLSTDARLRRGICVSNERGPELGT